MSNKTTSIIIGVVVLGVGGLFLYNYLKKKEEPEPPSGLCEEGDTQTKTCPEGSVIVTHRCIEGKMVATGATCPSEPPTESLAVFYVSDDDLSAAQLVKNSKPSAILIRGKNLGEGGTVTEALTDIGSYDVTISIGGQITNPLYQYAQWQGLLKELLAPGERETKRLVISGKDIIFAAGYTNLDTVNAVYEAINLI